MEKIFNERDYLDDIETLNFNSPNLSAEGRSDAIEHFNIEQTFNLQNAQNVHVGKKIDSHVNDGGVCIINLLEPKSNANQTTNSNFYYNYKLMKMKYILSFLFAVSLIVLFVVTFLLVLHNKIKLGLGNKNSKNQSSVTEVIHNHTINIPFYIQRQWRNPFDKFGPTKENKINNTIIKIDRIKFVPPQRLWFLCAANGEYEKHCETTLITERVIGRFLGYKDIIYHYVIHIDGAIYKGRPTYLNEDEEFIKDIGNSTLIIGISLCHDGNPFFIEKTLNESQSIKNLVNYLQDTKKLSKNYTFEIWDYCRGSLMNDKLSEITKNTVTFYDLKTTPFYKRYMRQFEFAGVNEDIVDIDEPCSITKIESKLQNVLFTFINVAVTVSFTDGEVWDARNKTFSTQSNYYEFVKDTLQVETFNIKYCFLSSFLENTISSWDNIVPYYVEAKPNETYILYNFRTFKGRSFKRKSIVRFKSNQSKNTYVNRN